MWKLCEKIREAFIDVGNDMGRLDNNIKLTESRKNKNVLNTERLRTAEDLFHQDEDDVEITLSRNAVQPPPVQEPNEEPAQEPKTCPVCFVGPLNAVWLCGHLLCVQCATTIKSHRQTARRICHLCRAPATKFIPLLGTY